MHWCILQTVESPDDLVAALDQFIGKIDKINKIITPIQPPESLKEQHIFTVNGLKELNTLLKGMKAATQTMDVEKLTTLTSSFEKKLTTIDKESKKITLKFIEQSKLAKLGNKLNDLNKQIDVKTADL